MGEAGHPDMLLLLQHHPMAQWTAEQLIEEVTQATPEVRADRVSATLPANAIKVFVKQHLETMQPQLSGKVLLQMIGQLGKDFSGSRMRDLVFGESRRDLDRLMAEAACATRGSKDFLETLLHKSVLSGCSTVISEAEKKIFDIIPKQCRNRAYDVFFPEEWWCIQSGEPTMVTYPKAFWGAEVRAIHGSYCSPRGWLRLGLDLDNSGSRTVSREEWSRWHKAYHGTAGMNLDSIIASGLITPPIKDGKIQHCHGAAGAGNIPVIYCSPSIEYAAHFIYTSEHTVSHVAAGGGSSEGGASPGGAPDSPLSSSGGLDWKSVLDGVLTQGDVFVQFVFEVRVKPGTYRVQGNTLCDTLWPDFTLGGARLPFEKDCSSRNLEWLVEDRNNIVCTGVMLREIRGTPESYNKQRIAEMERHVDWDKEQKRPRRPRLHGTPGGGPARWQWNSAPSTGSTLSRDEKAPWTNYAPEINDIIERAYQEYQRSVFIGKPPGAPGPYFIHFGNYFEEDYEWGPIQHRADGDREHAWQQRAVRRVSAAAAG